MSKRPTAPKRAALAAPARVLEQEFVSAMPLSGVTQHPRNAREGDVGAVGASIDANGFYGAIVVQKSTGYILAGNHRALAAAQHGIDALPALVVDVTDEEALRILLADNRTNDLASYNAPALVSVLEDLLRSPAKLAGTGYEPDDLDDLLAQLNGPPTEPAPAPGTPPPASAMPFLEWRATRIPMTDGEADELQAALDAWTIRVGSSFGFVANLLAPR